MEKPEVVLSEVSGNAMSVIAACTKAARKAGWSIEQIDAFVKQATSGDYDYVLATVLDLFDVS